MAKLKFLIIAVFFANLLPGMHEEDFVVIGKLCPDKIVLSSFKEKYFTHCMLSSYGLKDEVPKEIVNVILGYFFSCHQAEIMVVVEKIAPEINRNIIKQINYDVMVRYLYASFYQYEIENGFKFIDFESYVSCAIQLYREYFDSTFGLGIMHEFFENVPDNTRVRLLRIAEIVFRQYPEIEPGSFPSVCASALRRIINAKESHLITLSKIDGQKIEKENKLLLSRSTPANKSYALIALDFLCYNKKNEEQGPLKFKEYLLNLGGIKHIPFCDHVAAIMEEENYDNLNFMQYCKEKLSMGIVAKNSNALP